MAQIAVDPLFLMDVVLTVDGDTYEKHVSSVSFTPSISSATFKGLNPEAVFTETGAATWMCDLEYVQDWETTDSLSAYLFNNAGEEVSLTFKPRSGSGGSFSATVVIVDGAIGGSVDSYSTASVSLPVQGRPVFTPAG